MPDPSRHHLGVDFGTSNSFLAVASDGTLSATPIDFGGDGLRSIVLYRTDDAGIENVIAFGEHAEHEWGMATPHEKKSLRLASHFKPDISPTNETPRKDAAAFLKCLADDLVQRGALPAGKRPADFDVLIGVPANALPGYEETLAQVARESGFGDPQLVPEPIGALVGHLSRHEFSVRDARAGLLVIDFGGGTCDVAYVLRLEVRQAWGDPILGGRLFDDLFYQWFCQANPGATEAMAGEGDDYYVHWIKCREMKERFSETLARDRNARFRYAIRPYGRLVDATWDEFTARAGAYVPSDAFRDELARLGEAYTSLASGQPLDLLAWVRDVIVRGIRQDKIRIADVSYVILTGGSSAWPFVRDIVAQDLRIAPERILSSPNPRRAIGEGIALLPVLKKLHEKAITEIRAEQPTKAYEILNEVRRVVDAFLDALAADLAGEFVATIEPLLAEFRRCGGRLKDLERKIADQAPALETKAAELVQSRSSELTAKVNQCIADVLGPWFRSKHIQWTPERIELSQADPVSVTGPRVPVKDVFMTGLTAITSTVMAVVLGSLCGGAGTAWVLSGPPGWILGAAAGVIVTIGAAWGGAGYVRKLTGAIPIPSKLAWLALRKVDYDRIKRDTHASLIQAFRPRLESQRTELRRHVEHVTQAQIDDIGALDHL
ncbi:MAG: hypothetical protein JXQ73_07560 [Phycisphaerae bacterium]|nr:hypothetical protein [Phycisphaerae bacterium]